MGDHIGQQLGNYRLLRLLGQGSFADVYLGEHIHLGTQAAIKVLQVRLGATSIQNFLNEARTIAHLVHPYIIRVLDFGVQGTVPFLVMDYAPKGTFRQRFLQGKALPPAPLVSYMRQAAAALQYAHDRKLVHRDVKPENMLMGPNDEVLLSDFGFALIPQSSTSRSLTEETAGTAAYMAPEQLQGKPRPASDQYALGIISYEWLCGCRPFDGSFFEIASQQVLTQVPPMREKAPTIPREIEKVVMKALEKSPQERYPSTRDFALALEEACLTAKQYDFDLPSSNALDSQSATLNTNKTTREKLTPSRNQDSLRSNVFPTPSFSGRQAEQTQSPPISMRGFPVPEKLQSAYENFIQHQPPPANEQKSYSSPSMPLGPINRAARKTTLRKQSADEIPFQEYMAQFPLDDAQFRPNNDVTIQKITMPVQPPRSPSGIQPLSTLQPSQLEPPHLKPQVSSSGIRPLSRDQFPSSNTATPNTPATSSGIQRLSDIQQSSPGFSSIRSQRLSSSEQSSLTKKLTSDVISLRSPSTQQLTPHIQSTPNPQQTLADIKAYGFSPPPLNAEKLASTDSGYGTTSSNIEKITRNIFMPTAMLKKKFVWSNRIILFVVLCIVVVISSMFIYLANIVKQPNTGTPAPTANTYGNAQVALTATAQASATVTSVFNATAAARNSKNPYAPNTGILDMDDALISNNAHTWSENTNCQFTANGYQVTANKALSSTCFATDTNYKNFTYEVHMKFIKVGTEFSSAGVTFRGNHSTSQFYRFGIYASGRYNLEICAGDGAHCNSISDGKTAPPMPAYNPGTSGLNQPNVLAIEVLDNTLTVYINNQLAINPIQLPINTTMVGMIGVFANGGIDGDTVALFNNARIWAQ